MSTKAGTPTMRFQVDTWDQAATSPESGVLEIWRGIHDNTVQLLAGDLNNGAEAAVLLDFRVAMNLGAEMCSQGRKAVTAGEVSPTRGLPPVVAEFETYDAHATRNGTGLVELRRDVADQTVMIIVQDNTSGDSVALRVDGADMVQAGAALVAEARRAGASEE